MVMHEKNKYRNIPWNRYNLEKYRDINFWSYRPALVTTVIIRVGSDDALWGHWARGVFTPQTKFEKEKK